MTPQEYILDEGLDPTAVFGGYASIILESIRLAKPNSYRGMVIYAAAEPTVINEPIGYPAGWYEWQKRCVWTQPATGKLHAYKTGVGWLNVANQIDAGTIVNSMIAAGTITSDKLSISGGAALRILRINAANTAVEWASPSSVFGTGAIEPSALVPGNASYNYYLASNGGAVSWQLMDSGTLISLFSASEFPVNFLTHGTANQVLSMNSAGTAVEWAAVAGKIAAKSVDIAKLNPASGNNSKYLRVNSAGTDFELATITIPTSPNIQRTFADFASIPAAGAVVNAAHGLAAIPTVVTAQLVCVTPELDYVAGDVVELTAAEGINGANGDNSQAYSLTWDATNVSVRAQAVLTSVEIPHKTTRVMTAYTPANWKIQYTALRFY